MPPLQELESACIAADSAGKRDDAKAFADAIHAIQRNSHHSLREAQGPFAAPQTALGRASLAAKNTRFAAEARNQDIAYWSFSGTVMILFILIAWGWGKWRIRFESSKAFVFGLKPGEVLQVTWVISKCALAIATTILILNLIHDRPWLWLLKR